MNASRSASDCERRLFRIGVPAVMASLFLLVDLLLHEFLGERWHSSTHWVMAVLLLVTSFIVLAIHQRTLERRALSRDLLEEREASYRALFDLFPEPSTVWSPQGRLLMQNLVSARNLGGEREAFIGRSILDIFGGEAGRSYLARIQRVYETGAEEEQEDAILLSMGRRVFWTAMQRVRTPRHGDAVQVISYDVTERVAAEQAWREEHQRASMYLNIAAVIIVALDTHRRVTLINARGCEILSYRDSEIVGQDWMERFVPTRHREQMLGDFRRFLAGELGPNVSYENPVLTRSGEERLIAWKTVVVRDEAGAIVGTLSSGEDITDQRRAEEALRASELLRVQERSALEERQRLARELHDSVSQALYGVALGVNTGLTLLDRDREATREALNYSIGLARAGLSEMRALIFELRPESLESEGLRAALAKQTEAIQARFELSVIFEACDEPALPLSTKEALYRIGQEALRNVVKHAQATGLEVRLSCAPGCLTMSVRDDGIGFRVADEHPGHLGLKSMRERAERIGATLRIESAPGAGALVEVQLPLDSAA